MQKRTAGWLLLALGALGVLLVLFYDSLFMGSSAGFGLQQIIALVVSLGVAAVGFSLKRRG